MKAPSPNISASLRSQSEGGRTPSEPKFGRLKPAVSVSMTVPGQGGIEAPPGHDSRQGVDDRSARSYANVAGIVK